MKYLVRKLRFLANPNLELDDESRERLNLRSSGVSAHNFHHFFIALMNSKPNAGTHRIVEVIEACHEVSRMMKSIKSAESEAVLVSELNGAVGRLNKLMGTYRWQPYIFGSVDAGSHFKILYVIVTELTSSNLDVEIGAIQWIVEHIDAVDRIRRCMLPQCRKWYFAKTDRQKYCGDNCRQRAASKGEEFKKKRRIYQKKYRRDLAQREARAKQLVKRRSR